MFKVQNLMTLQKSEKLKIQGPVTGGHKSRFLSDNCLLLLEKLSILSDWHQWVFL